MWNKLEHQVWNNLKENQLENEPVYLLAVSGGLDSMVLAHLIQRLRPQAKIVLMHYHHGQDPQKKFRDQALELVQKQKEVIVEFAKSDKNLSTEFECREARLDFFKSIQQKYQTQFYVTAHHQDDVLETRLLKLVRGAGADSLLAFKDWNGLIYRPFFAISKSELLDYAHEQKIPWVTDSTNEENEYFRNWMRNEWLPALENKHAGALKSFSKSLQNLLNDLEIDESAAQAESARYVVISADQISIDRLWLLSLPTKDQLKVLIRALRAAFSEDFTQGQLKEVLRRLDKNQNDHIFTVAGLNWVITAHNIMIKYND